MIKFTILRQSNLQPDHYHSLLISLLRGLAALQVAAAHLRAQVYPGYGQVENPSLAFQGLAFVTGFAHLAVIVFFVLSGWLVGGSLLNKAGDENAIKNYAIDRITRLWIVLIPTFGAIVMLGLAAGWLDTGRPDFGLDGEYSFGAFLGNLFGLQNLVVPEFGGDFPLWSLSNETWYYIMFPLLVVMFRARTIAGRTFSIVALLAISQLLTVTILLYFAVWLLGTVFSRIRIETNTAVRWLLLLVFAMTAVYFRLKGKNDDMTPASFVQDMTFGVAFVLFLSSMQFKPRSRPILVRLTDRVGQFFANFSFTLYVLHVPLILALVHFSRPYFAHSRLSPENPVHFAFYFAMLAGLVLLSYLFYLPFEGNTHRVRNWLKNALAGRSAAARI